MKVGFKDIDGWFLGVVTLETQEVNLQATEAEADIVLSLTDSECFDCLKEELEYRMMAPERIIGLLIRSLLILSARARKENTELFTTPDLELP
ncbi:MAG: hypothetical protein U9M98_00020 [Patescibacteria group bacterium]|nr:hypothetical protein [Patescibacteria group bacterium]